MNIDLTERHTAHTELDALWQPLKIGSLVTKNRVYLPAHHPSLPPEQYAHYLGARARGGVGLIVTQANMVHPSSDYPPNKPPWKREWISEVETIVRPSAEVGTPMLFQLSHLGGLATGKTDESWGPVWGPSAIPLPPANVTPKVMTEDDIESLIDGFTTTAAHALEGGAQGVEIHGAHGYLVGTFMSPYWNRRSDKYGGDTAARARLAIEIGRAIRSRCGKDFVIGMKMSTNEYIGNVGIEEGETAALLTVMHEAAVFDYFNVSHTDYHSSHRLIDPFSSGQKESPLAAAAAAARGTVRGEVPILMQGSVRTIEEAAKLVSGGSVDMVGLVRAHIADPDLVRKSQAGNRAEVRRCVGANQGCLRRFGSPMSCTVNPRTGREATWNIPPVDPQADRLKVLVVGGGPAGLKCAEAQAMAGHTVTLWEASDRLGGQLRYAGRLPGQHTWNFLVDDLTASIGRLGVDARLNRHATAEAVSEFGADLVVVATGSTWQTTGFSTFRPDRNEIPRTPGALVTDPLGAIDGVADGAHDVVIIDDNGDHAPMSLAQELSGRGKSVTIVTAAPNVGGRLQASSEFPWVFPRVLAAGVSVRGSSFVEEIGDNHVVVRSAWGGEPEKLASQAVVMSMMRTSADELYWELVESGSNVIRIGDCVAPREADDAVLEGLRTGIPQA